MKKEIDFDFTKWGQDGISVDDHMGRLIIKLHENPIKDEFYGISHDDCTFALPKNKFKMFEEVKPREFWVNVYKDSASYVHTSKEDAEISKFIDCIETIKVVEVLD